MRRDPPPPCAKRGEYIVYVTVLSTLVVYLTPHPYSWHMSVIDIEQDRHALEHHINGIEAAIPASLLDLLGSSKEGDTVDLESPSAKAYLDRLVSLDLDHLVQEPSLISNERSAVDLELVNLCYREYSTFTSVHQCSAAIGAAFDDFDNSLDKLIESIPALEDECRQFGRGTSEIQTARKKAVLLQEHEDKLLDVLEIPQLLETCVRNGYYQEALELSTHVSTLREKHHAIIIDDVADEANGILHLMTAQLLGVLREPVKLPALIKAVGYLRRLQDLDDTQLGLAFLSSRLVNYRARLIDIEKDRAEPVRYLRRYIDLFREHVFDIISQHTTIFPAVDTDQLASFVNLCVDDLCQLVHRYIPRIASDSAAMSSILVQLGYCSLSFARAGLDFSALLIDPFKTTVQMSYDQATDAATTAIKTTLAIDAQAAAASPQSLVSAYHLQQILLDPHSPPHIRHEADDHTPPSVLAHFPPIAQFLNAHLAALNALRLLAPSQSLPELQASQNKSIQAATASVLDYVEQAVSTETSGDLSRTGSRSRHSRTNSTPRAHLLRRNTETQLSAETLAAQRRESKRTCVAFVDAWIMTCEFLSKALGIVLETQGGKVDDQVEKQLKEWIEANRERELDGPEVESKQANGETMMALDEAQEAAHGDGHGSGDEQVAEVAAAVSDTEQVQLNTTEPFLDAPSIQVAQEEPIPDEIHQPSADYIAPGPIASAEELLSIPKEQDVEVDDHQERVEHATPPPTLESAVEPASEPSLTEPIESLVTTSDPVSRDHLAEPLPAPLEEAIEVEESSKSVDGEEIKVEVPGTVADAQVDKPTKSVLVTPPLPDEALAVEPAEPADSVGSDARAIDSTPSLGDRPFPSEPGSTSLQVTESNTELPPLSSATALGSATPEEEEEVGEQASGTVTPIADPNQEPSASKASKKKKKKKGKK